MQRYILKRILIMIPILFAIAVLVFTMMYVTPGDPVRIKLGDTITEKAYNIERERLGLDKPYLIQLGTFLLKLVRGDLGESFRNGQSVSKEVASRLPYTLKLSLLSMVVAIMIGVTTGIISAIKQYSILDNVVTALSLFGVSAPAFWIALMMVLLFAVHLGWLPPSGTYGPQYWIMPVATLGLNQGATIMRFTRTSMLDVIRQDYIQTARAKGQKESVIILNHALRNALMPIVTVLGVQLGALMTGSILVETVFSIPGIGKFLVDSVNMRDRPSLQATVIVIGFLCSTINLLVDILYCCIDPRVKTTLIQRKEG